MLAVRGGIERALAYTNGSDTFEDVVAGVLGGRMQFWRYGESFVISEVTNHPRKRSIYIFLAGGKMERIRAMVPVIQAWAVANGCSEATLLGRKGWTRSFLMREGWEEIPVVMLRKQLGV